MTLIEEDIELLVQSELPIEEIAGTTIMVTGATGLIGSLLIKTLIAYNEKKNTNIQIVAFARNKQKAQRIFGNHIENKAIIFQQGDINDTIQIEENIDYIIHGASATSSKYFVSNPVETIKTAINGTQNILELAKEKKIKGMVYLSSLEVYGTPNGDKKFITEQDYGYIDTLSVRSSYSEGKRMVECMCVAFASEYHIPVKIARLSQTFGAGVEYNDGRVFAEFSRCALERKNIVLHTEGKTVRSYCYTKDAISAIFYILIRGVTGEAYNVTNTHTAISIRNMAELVCELFPEAEINVTFDVSENVEQYGYNPEMLIRLDSSKLEKLGWKPTTDLKEMFQRMIESF